MKNDELLPCPFCGALPTKYKNVNMLEMYRNTDRFTCTTDDCLMNSVHFTQEEWNTREQTAAQKNGVSAGSGAKIVKELIPAFEALDSQQQAAPDEEFSYRDALIGAAIKMAKVEGRAPPAIPEGYVLVPKEPTPEMVFAGVGEHQKWQISPSSGIFHMYKAMIEAAQKGGESLRQALIDQGVIVDDAQSPDEDTPDENGEGDALKEALEEVLGYKIESLILCLANKDGVVRSYAGGNHHALGYMLTIANYRIGKIFVEDS